MPAYRANDNDLGREVDPHNEAILHLANVNRHAAILEDGRCSIPSLQVGEAGPRRTLRLVKPRSQ